MFSKKRWAVNYTSTLGLLATQAGMGLILTPYLIKNIGIDSFGVVQLSQNVIAYMTIVSLVIQTALGRHLSIAVNQGHQKEANDIFNIGFWIILCFCIVLIPVGVGLSYYLPRYLSIPIEEANSTSYFFLWVFASVAVLSLSSYFLVTAYVLNRIEIKSLVEIFTRVSKIGLIILFFSVMVPSIYNVGLAFFVASGLTLILAFYCYRKLMPHLYISHPAGVFNSDYGKVLSTSAWVFIAQLSGLLFIQTELLVVGGVYGTEALGEYASLVVWVILFRSFAGAISGVLNPVFFKQASVSDLKSMQSLACFSMTIIGLCIALPLGFVIVLSGDILSVWITLEFSHLAPILCIMLVHLVVNLTTLPLMGVQVALDKVKVPAIISLILGLINIILMVVVSIYTDVGIIIIAVIGGVVLTLKNGVFTACYAAKILGVNVLEIYWPILRAIGALTISCLIYAMLGEQINADGYVDLIVIFVIGVLPCFIVSWFLLISKPDQVRIRSMFINKKMPC